MDLQHDFRITIVNLSHAVISSPPHTIRSDFARALTNQITIHRLLSHVRIF